MEDLRTIVAKGVDQRPDADLRIGEQDLLADFIDMRRHLAGHFSVGHMLRGHRLIYAGQRSVGHEAGAGLLIKAAC